MHRWTKENENNGIAVNIEFWFWKHDHLSMTETGCLSDYESKVLGMTEDTDKSKGY